MTKQEEILKRAYESKFPSQKYENRVNRKMDEEWIKPAMDEYAGWMISNSTSVTSKMEVPEHILNEFAKVRAIEFGDWKDDFYMEVDSDYEDDEVRYYSSYGADETKYTIEQLYNEFIKATTNKQ